MNEETKDWIILVASTAILFILVLVVFLMLYEMVGCLMAATDITQNVGNKCEVPGFTDLHSCTNMCLRARKESQYYSENCEYEKRVSILRGSEEMDIESLEEIKPECIIEYYKNEN